MTEHPLLTSTTQAELQAHQSPLSLAHSPLEPPAPSDLAIHSPELRAQADLVHSPLEPSAHPGLANPIPEHPTQPVLAICPSEPRAPLGKVRQSPVFPLATVSPGRSPLRHHANGRMNTSPRLVGSIVILWLWKRRRLWKTVVVLWMQTRTSLVVTIWWTIIWCQQRRDSQPNGIRNESKTLTNPMRSSLVSICLAPLSRSYHLSLMAPRTTRFHRTV